MATIKLFNQYVRIPLLLLALTELAIFFGAIYVGIELRFFGLDALPQEVILSLGDTLSKALIYSFAMLLGMTAVGNYQLQSDFGLKRFRDTLVRYAVAFAIGSGLLILLYYAFPGLYLGRGVTGLAVAFSFWSSVLVRMIFFKVIDSDNIRRNVMVYGSGHSANHIFEQMKKNTGDINAKINLFIPIKDEPIIVPESMVLESDKTLLEITQEKMIDEIIICMDDRRHRFPAEELMECRMSGVSIIDPTAFLEREQGKVILKNMNPSWLIFSEGCNRTSINESFSRAFDITASLIILALTWPVLLLTALLISAESKFKHPIFYKQQRIGLNNKIFNVYKFRSMIVNAEKEGQAKWATKNDARVTRVGKFIRKTRIDEIPQIINILRGDMSLVGPRPERPQFVDELEKKIPYYAQRHTIKPGLAGWAQLKYPYGASEEDAYEKLQYDLYYVKNNNIIMDFFILLQTAEIVLFGKGAR